ncbi:hypothetical protein BGZ76_006506 [Entomortierella beljakovae]|nr:hypothetical protein BGZ76_006506 [Entomortierella beljakovae]
MADRPTTTSTRPRPTTTRPAATRTTTAARKTTTTTRSTRSTRATSTRSTTTTTTSSTASPTPTIDAGGGGSSGGAIGGALVGVAVVLGLVGFLLYRRKKKATVAAAKNDQSMAEARTANAAISGPMALAPENGSDAAPAHRSEAQFREQQQYKPGMRDELFAPPGSVVHNKENNNSNNNNNNNNNNNYGNETGYGYGNEKDVYSGNRANQNDSYEDNLVNDYYGGDGPEPIGAQRPAPQAKDVMHGNLTPAPEYYMGKEDIDPRRDLRGLDSPESYVKTPLDNHANANGSPRTSYDSGRESGAYQTLEQAQQAHNQKMMGHKHSIGSVGDLNPERSHQENSSGGRTNQPADHLLSVAMTESTVSMMPALPPAASTAPANGAKGNAYDARMQEPYNRGPPPRGNQGPISPRAREDPYAESAFSEDYGDDRSLASGYYNGPAGHGPGNGNGYGNGYGNGHYNHNHQHGYNGYPNSPTPPYYSQGGGGGGGGRGGAFSPQPMSPPYRQNYPGYPQQGHGPPQGGYNNYNGGGGGGGGRPYGPGPGSQQPYPNSRQQYPGQNGPGYQRDGPYNRQY